MSEGWDGMCKTLIQNKSHTVGVVKVIDPTKVRKIVGYWDKNLLKEVMDVLDTFEYRDFEISVVEDAELGASILLLKSPNLKDESIYVAIAGKTEAQE